MEHPFINNLESLTLEELGSKISDLQKKLMIAHRSGNSYLCDQVRMAIASYQNKYQEKLAETFKSKTSNGPDLDSKIDIS